MFENLQHKWKVGGTQLLLVLTTFAIGGTLTGWVARKLMFLFTVEQPLLWTILYIILLSLLWPLMVIMVSLPFGQFSFFRKYLSRIQARIMGRKPPVRVAIFASGTGSNAEKIMEYFDGHPQVTIDLVVSNKAEAGVLAKAAARRVETLVIEKEAFFRGDAYVPFLKSKKIDFIVLAGFLWKIPPTLIAAFPNRMINIHPALLPKYGGKGMYGRFVHEAVIASGDTESGITIHFVDEQYDHGGTIFQAKCSITPGDNPETLAGKIHQLEHENFPRVIEQTILTQVVKK